MKSAKGLTIPVGLALLYASGYFLPRVGMAAGYWLPAVGRQILYPSAMAVILLIPVTTWFSNRYLTQVRPGPISVIAIVGLCWIASLGVFRAAGYSLLDVAESMTDRSAVVEARWIRIGMVVLCLSALFFVVLKTLKYRARTLRLLAVLGYLFTTLAFLRTFNSPHGPMGTALNRFPAVGPPTATPGLPPRQVVWIILDELDYDQTLGRTADRSPADPPMPNLDHLAQVGVSAVNAYPPARDTIASIPALLTGYAPTALTIDSRGLRLRTQESGVRNFDESDSLFARLPGGPASAAILGFYHPYCTVFPSVTPCVAYPKDNVGRWFDAFTGFVEPIVASSRWLPSVSSMMPEFLHQSFLPMYRISQETLRLYPAFLSLPDKALVYIHVNLPHTPGDYSQRVFRTRDAGDDRTAYRRNLRLADQLIGQATSILTARARGQDILLIVSSDHWLRIDSPLTPRRIPWIAWHVGETQGQSIAEPISTVHSGDLIESFLGGQIDSQSQIAGWWKGQRNYPTLMPHGYSYE